ncbi:MAG: mechanosensitive ion channel family protein [Ignavibacteriales bacterium]|nr:MAG: mechanosensitive ion channel family protein [Ignavibacteriales bacterium]
MISFLQLVFATGLLLSSTFSAVQNSDSGTVVPELPGSPVISGNDTLFLIYTNAGLLNPQQRAEAISNRIKSTALETDVPPDSIIINEYEGIFEITAGETILMQVTPKDAFVTGTEARFIAEHSLAKIRAAVANRRTEYASETVLINSLYTFGALILLTGFIWLLLRIFTLLIHKIEDWKTEKIRSVEYKGVEFFSPQNLNALLASAARLLLITILAGSVYYTLVYIVTLWPATRGLNLIPYIAGIFQFLLYSLFLFLIIRGLKVFRGAVQEKVQAMQGTIIRPVTLRGIQVISEERLMGMTHQAITVLFLSLWVIIIYLYITLIFGLFPFSRGWSSALVSFILSPVLSVWASFTGFLPNLFYIIVIAGAYYYLNRFIGFLFHEIEKGTINFSGFYNEWAKPTYKVVRFLIIVLAVISIFPYLPGSDSPIFQGISVFVGLLLSLGSTSAISNIVAGVVLTYMRPFKLGDRVKIADTMGDVVEKTLLVTRIRTTKNVDITVPNSMVLGNHIINFSTASADPGLILHTTVTIGYDVPWQKVHQLLIDSASSTDQIMKEPKPFVLQTALNDFSVAYELNAYTNNPNAMARIYSALHASIQDKFNEAGVEIMSPIYNAVRDGNQSTIPEDYLPKDYKKPSFNIFKQS